jgi:uncharacterized protein (DUF2062 family)
VKAAAYRFWASVAGLSPEAMALIIALGLVLGVFPVFGLPTLLCALAALVLRLNLPAIQLVNQLSSPLQLALLIPLSRIGARISGESAAWSFTGAARDAMAGWFCLCVPLGLVLYLILLFTLRRLHQEWFNGLESPG